MNFSPELSNWFNDKEIEKHAIELYKKEYFTVIKDFILTEELETLTKRFSKEESLKQTTDDGTCHKMFVKYLYINRDIKDEPLLFNIIKKAFEIRNKVALHKHSDQYLREYILRHKLPHEDLNQIYKHQMSHSFVRICNYKEGCGQHPHWDFPGEIQAIIPLTKKGKDFDEGGLLIHKENKKINLDELVSPGDLVLLNSYQVKHEVQPVAKTKNQVGRLHIFVPQIPDYYFAKGRGYYFFKSSPLKIYTTVPTNRIRFLSYYLMHLFKLITCKSTSEDHLIWKQ